MPPNKLAELRALDPNAADVIEAAESYVAAWEVGHEEEHMFVQDLRAALEKWRQE